MVLGNALTGVFVWWAGAALPRLEDVGVSPSVAAFAVSAIAVAALVCGVIPAWLLSEAPVRGLNDESRSTSGSAAQGRARRIFVAAQVAAALTLLVATVVTVRSFARLQSVNPGFEGGDVLSIQLTLPPTKYAKPADIVTFADKLRADFLGLVGVRDAAAISLMPLTGLLSTQDYKIVGAPEPPPDEVPQAHYRIAMPGYFRIMRIAVQGRDFTDDDRESTRRVAIVSRALATRHWSTRTPIGEHILLGPDSLEVIGVCDDVKQFGLDGDRTADLYVPLRQMPANQRQFIAARMYWVLQTGGDPMQEADAVRTTVRRLDNEVATSSIRPVSQIVTASIGARRFNAHLINIAAIASLLLALIGVYSVTAFSLSRRTREIGIRLVLGALPREVVRSVVASEWIAIAVGLLLGTIGGVVVSRVLSSVLYGITGAEPVLIAAAAGAFGTAAAAASYLPARRASRANPMLALRQE